MFEYCFLSLFRSLVEDKKNSTQIFILGFTSRWLIANGDDGMTLGLSLEETIGQPLDLSILAL